MTLTESQILRADVRVPSWFTYLVSIHISFVSIVGIPWLTWVTYTLIVIQSETGGRWRQFDLFTDRLSVLEKEKSGLATELQVISATRFTAEHGRLLTSALEARLDRLEQKIELGTKEIVELHRVIDRLPKSPTGEG